MGIACGKLNIKNDLRRLEWLIIITFNNISNILVIGII
jgi:hypothetical protein